MTTKYSTDISAERLREVLHYCPDTGLFRWLKAPSFRVKIGGIAGHLHSSGYITIRIDGKSYRAHRLAFLYVNGSLPRGDIDHADGDRSNNRFDNIREATRSENNQNQQRLNRRNQTGFRGVHFRKDTRKFSARICAGKRIICLGDYATAEEAYAAYLSAKAKFHPFSNHLTNSQSQSLPVEAGRF